MVARTVPRSSVALNRLADLAQALQFLDERASSASARLQLSQQRAFSIAIHRLVGESRNQLDLLVAERLHLFA